MKQTMNFLPIDGQKRKSPNLPKRKSRIIMMGSVLLLISSYGILFFLDLSCQTKIGEVEAMINSKAEYQVIYTNLNYQNELLKERTHIEEAINRDKDRPLKALDEIHKAIPAEVTVLNYSFQEGSLTISGETRNKEKILEFKDKLTAIDQFKVINMVNTTKKSETTSDNKSQVSEEVWQFMFNIEMNEV